MVAGMSNEAATAEAQSSQGMELTPVDPNSMLSPTRIDTALPDVFDTLVGNAARKQGATDLPGFQRNVAAAIATNEPWAESYVNDMARMAWYAESGGKEGPPQAAPTSYIKDWKSMWKYGQNDAPGQQALNQRMVDLGVPPPSAAKQATGPAPTSYHLNAFPGLRSGVAGGSIVPDQYNAEEIQNLPGWQKDAACGITAGIGVARALGLRPSAQDALVAARTVGGWTAGGGMGGTGGEVKMLEKMGVPVIAQYNAKGEYIPERADQGVIDAELAAGRPVIIDTVGAPRIEAGHYFAIVGKTDQGYVVSGSGTALKQGAEVMTRQQMANITGDWRNMVRLDPSRMPQSPAQAAPSPAPASTAAPPRPLSLPEGPPTGQANVKPIFNEPEVRSMQDRIMNEMPEINITPVQGSVEDRMAQVMPAAEWLEREYGYPAESLVGMMFAENGVGQVASPAVLGNNYFSLQWDKGENDKYATGYAPGQGSDPRWGAYPSVKAALARKIGMLAHPDNTYNKLNGARLWEQRSNPDTVIPNLVKGHYIIPEPGKRNSIPEWTNRFNEGRAIYRKMRATRAGR